MKLSEFFSSKEKFHQFENYDSYRLIEYKSKNDSINELIWNSTNLNPPEYVLDKSNRIKLLYHKSHDRYINYPIKIGDRFFGYKTPSAYIKDRSPVLKFYWEKNFFNCNELYSSYEEFFAISCINMTKQRLELKVFNGIH